MGKTFSRVILIVYPWLQMGFSAKDKHSRELLKCWRVFSSSAKVPCHKFLPRLDKLSLLREILVFTIMRCRAALSKAGWFLSCNSGFVFARIPGEKSTCLELAKQECKQSACWWVGIALLSRQGGPGKALCGFRSCLAPWAELTSDNNLCLLELWNISAASWLDPSLVFWHFCGKIISETRAN